MFAAFLIPGFVCYCLPLALRNWRWLFAGSLIGAALFAYLWWGYLSDDYASALQGAALVVPSYSFATGVAVRAIQLLSGRSSALNDGLGLSIIGGLLNLAITLFLLAPAS